MSDAELRLNTPERLLDRGDGGLGELLLRSSSVDGPPQSALQRALIASSAALSGVVVASAAAASSGSASSVGSAAGLKGALAATSGATSGAATGAAVHAGVAGSSGALLAGGAAKAIFAWTLGGCLLGAVASGTALEVSTHGAWRKSPTSAVSTSAAGKAPRSRPEARSTKVAAAPLDPRPSAAEPGVEPRAAAGRDLGAPLARSFAPKSSAGASHQAAPTELAGSERRLTQKATSATFAGELAQIDAARERLRAGDASLALELVRTYQSSFPDGQLRPEALAIAVEAELRSGRSAEARATAARFFSAYPNHPLAARIRALLGED